MAITQPPQTVTLTVQERTWRINIEAPLVGDTVITVFREIVKTDSTGAVVAKSPATSAVRKLTDITAKSFTVNGVTLTGQQLHDIIQAIADQWRQADIAAGII